VAAAGQLTAAIDDLPAVQYAVDAGKHHFDFIAVMPHKF